MKKIIELIIVILICIGVYFLTSFGTNFDRDKEIQKNIEQGWIVSKKGKVYAVFSATSHQSCMGCHSRVKDDRRIPKDQRCPSWEELKDVEKKK